MKEDRKIVELSLDDILPNRFQPRIKFNEISILELSESIKEHGVIQPIVVRKIGSTKYEIIAGERRYKASKMAGKQSIPAIITELNDKDSVEIALIENVQRENLTPIEEAISYRKILDMGYITQEDLANKLGKTQSTIANKLRLLNLSEEVQEALLENKISERHARSLLKIKREDDQKRMLDQIIEERLTVRKTDEEIDKMLENNDNLNILNQNPEGVVVNQTSVNIPSVPIINDASVMENPTVVPIIIPVPTVDAPTPIAPSIVPEMNVEEIIPQMTSEPSVFSPIFNPQIEEPQKEELEEIVPPTQIDVDKIATSATDLYTEKPIVNIESLLIPSTESKEVSPEVETPLLDKETLPEIKPLEQVISTQEIDETTNILQPGRFFNIFPEEDINNEGSVPSFNFDSVIEDVKPAAVQNIATESIIPKPTPVIETTPLPEVPTMDYTQMVAPIQDNIIEPVAAPTIDQISMEEPIIPIMNNVIPSIPEAIPAEPITIEPIMTVASPISETLATPAIASSPGPEVSAMDYWQMAQPIQDSIIGPIPAPLYTPESVVPEVSVPDFFPINEPIGSGMEAPDIIKPAVEDKVISTLIPETPITIAPTPFDDFNPYAGIQGNLTPLTPQKNTNTMGAINAIRNCVTGLENSGYSVDTDEFDLENMYQVIIKIEK